MIQTVNFSHFCDAFGEERKNQFTYEGKRALFDYLENYEEETSTPVELDIIALCCEYTEYEDMKELQENYSNIEDMNDLEDHTQLIKIKGTDRFIIQNF